MEIEFNFSNESQKGPHINYVRFEIMYEAHIIYKAKTLEPLGINKRDQLQSVTKKLFICFSYLSSYTLPHHILCNFRLGKVHFLLVGGGGGSGGPGLWRGGSLVKF